MADVVVKKQLAGETNNRKRKGGEDSKQHAQRDAKEGKYRQRLQVRKEKVEQWEKKMEMRECQMINQKIWIENWMRKRQQIEDAVRIGGVRGCESFNKMEQDLKEMKTEMEEEHEQILKEMVDIGKIQKEILDEKEEIRKEMGTVMC